MTTAIKDDMMNEMYNANYLINIAALKAHARSGVTFCAKNHFGSSTHGKSYGASRLHIGSINPNESGGTGQGNDNLTNARVNYHMYRVLTDLIGHEKLGGNTVLFVVDGLWGGIEATDMPVKWQIAPFNNDFPSSLFVSQDEVAVESVCLDFLRAEADVNTYFNNRPFFPAVDDFLHQAATKANWPDSIANSSNKWFAFAGYDPEGDGTFMPSMGVHEHWNNAANKQYSRDLYTNGTGIDLVTYPSNLVSHGAATALNLTITVTDSTTPLPNAMVKINGANYLTDGTGKVVIGNLQATTGLGYTVSKKDYLTSSGTVDVTTDVEKEVIITSTLHVGIHPVSQVAGFKSYPNPFMNEVKIQYALNVKSNVSIKIYNTSGQLVANVLNENQSAGSHIQKWIPPANLRSGVYFANVYINNNLSGSLKLNYIK
jgi:hypothetical protein